MMGSKEIYRAQTFMTANLNGWDAEERETRQQQGGRSQKSGGPVGPKVLRRHRLRTLLKSHAVDVLAVQEHHYKQEQGESKEQAMERLEKGIARFKWVQWESAATLADTPH